MRTEQSLAASRYALALLESAAELEKGVDERVLKELSAINKAIEGSDEFEIVLAHPGISSNEKKEMLIKVFAKSAHELTIQLLNLLADKRRLELLEAIEVEYHRLLNERKNIVHAQLTSAEPLKDATLASIKAKLAERLDKHLELEVKIDNSILGGLVLKIGDQVIDGSLKTKLESLEKSLLAV